MADGLTKGQTLDLCRYAATNDELRFQAYADRLGLSQAKRVDVWLFYAEYQRNATFR